MCSVCGWATSEADETGLISSPSQPLIRLAQARMDAEFLEPSIPMPPSGCGLAPLACCVERVRTETGKVFYSLFLRDGPESLCLLGNSWKSRFLGGAGCWKCWDAGEMLAVVRELAMLGMLIMLMMLYFLECCNADDANNAGNALDVHDASLDVFVQLSVISQRDISCVELCVVGRLLHSRSSLLCYLSVSLCALSLCARSGRSYLFVSLCVLSLCKKQAMLQEEPCAIHLHVHNLNPLFANEWGTLLLFFAKVRNNKVGVQHTPRVGSVACW